MKKGLIGISNNITLNKSKIELWSKSFKLHSDGEVILLAANANEEDIKTCEELNLKYEKVEIEAKDLGYINNKRFIHTVDYLKNSDIDLFMVTDVFDVLFQNDPFEKMDLENYDFFVSGEGINVKQEPWNFDVVKKVFPDDLESCLNQEIICSGVMGGKRESLIPIFEQMYTMCEESGNLHNIKDQAALIVMIAKNQIPKIKIFNLDDGWAVHCAVAGPTPFFESWGFKNAIKARYGIPKLVNESLFTEADKLYDIVHQFNRVQEWESIFKAKYKI